MDELKQKLLEMMSWFHDFCVKNNLTYYAVCGTMLGAARHEGFIPWDDDIDVGMPRDDFNKLELLMQNDIFDGKYTLETSNTDSGDFFYPFSKLYDTRTTLIENTKYKIKRGIYIDIFPLDGLGNTVKECKKNYRYINLLNKTLLLKVAGYRKGRSVYKNLGVFLFRAVPLNSKKMLNKLVSECSKRKFSDFSYCGILIGGLREVVPKKVFGTPKLYKFESIEIYGVENPDEYLKSLYGNWRKLPPEDKRKSQHDYILIDLGKSYIE